MTSKVKFCPGFSECICGPGQRTITQQQMADFDPVLTEHYPGFRVTLRMSPDGESIELKVVDIRNPNWNRRFVWSHEQLNIQLIRDCEGKEFEKVFDVADRLVKELKAEPVKVRLYPEIPLPVKVDPLDVEIDGVKLRTLLDGDAFNRQEQSAYWKAKPMTPAQRAAVSAHWSAELRVKVESTKVKERNMVTYCEEDDL